VKLKPWQQIKYHDETDQRGAMQSMAAFFDSWERLHFT